MAKSTRTSLKSRVKTANSNTKKSLNFVYCYIRDKVNIVIHIIAAHQSCACQIQRLTLRYKHAPGVARFNKVYIRRRDYRYFCANSFTTQLIALRFINIPKRASTFEVFQFGRQLAIKANLWIVLKLRKNIIVLN